MAQKQKGTFETNEAQLGAGAAAAGYGARNAVASEVARNAKIDKVTETARGQLDRAMRESNRIAQKWGNRAIPAGHADAAALQAAKQAEQTALSRIATLRGSASTLGRVASKDILGGAGKVLADNTGRLGKLATSNGTLAKIGRGGIAAGAQYALGRAITDNEDERYQRIYNKLKYGHFETNDELGKRGSVTETGHIGEGALSEEEVHKFIKENQNAFGREYGGHGELVHGASDLIANIVNPIGGLIGGTAGDKWIDSAESKFGQAMADSLASQAQGRRVRNNADNLYGEVFARGLMGGHLPLENMQGVGGVNQLKVNPYVDPAIAQKQVKAKAAYDAASDKDIASAVVRPNAAQEGGQRWFQDVNQLTNLQGVDPSVMRQAQAAMMAHQGLISKDDLSEMYYGHNQQEVAGMHAQELKGNAQQNPNQATPAAVVQNANSGLSNVSNPLNPNIRIPPPTNPQDAENLLRTRAIMNGTSNVQGAIGESQAAYMNDHGMMTAKQWDKNLNAQLQDPNSSIRQGLAWMNRNNNPYAARTKATGLPEGIDAGDDWAMRMYSMGKLSIDQLPESVRHGSGPTHAYYAAPRPNQSYFDSRMNPASDHDLSAVPRADGRPRPLMMTPPNTGDRAFTMPTLSAQMANQPQQPSPLKPTAPAQPRWNPNNAFRAGSTPY